MEESISKHNIRLHCTAKNWEDAIRTSAAPLVECGSINPSYIDRMIASVHELGPYIVIMPGFAIAHAAPGDDVTVSDLSVATFSEDVTFGCDNDPVRIVMCLACTDREAHIARLQRIAEKLLDDTFLNRMGSCVSADELYSLLNE